MRLSKLPLANSHPRLIKTDGKTQLNRVCVSSARFVPCGFYSNGVHDSARGAAAAVQAFGSERQLPTAEASSGFNLLAPYNSGPPSDGGGGPGKAAAWQGRLEFLDRAAAVGMRVH